MDRTQVLAQSWIYCPRWDLSELSLYGPANAGHTFDFMAGEKLLELFLRLKLTISSVQRNRETLFEIPYVRRWNRGKNNMPDDYPYRSHGQPITAYVSFAACLFILFIANGASLWKDFRWQQFLAAYLAVR